MTIFSLCCAVVIISLEQGRELILTEVNGKTMLGAAFKRKDAVSLTAFVRCLVDAGPLDGTQVQNSQGPALH